MKGVQFEELLSLDVESLESYIRDDVDRISTKLGVVHERMKGHYSDMLRPALDPAVTGQDGVNWYQLEAERKVSCSRST